MSEHDEGGMTGVSGAEYSAAGAAFLSGEVMNRYWRANHEDVLMAAAKKKAAKKAAKKPAKKKAPAKKAPAKKKKPGPKPTRGPGCVTRDPSCNSGSPSCAGS